MIHTENVLDRLKRIFFRLGSGSRQCLVGVVFFWFPLLIGGTTSAREVTVQLSLTPQKEIFGVIPMAAGILELGSLPTGDRKKCTLNLINLEKGNDFQLLLLRSPCSCIVFPKEIPGVIKAGTGVSIDFYLNVAGYLGPIQKFIYLRLQNGSSVKDLRFTIRFTADDSAVANKEKPPAEAGPDLAANVATGIQYLEYNGGGRQAYETVPVWLFSSRNCPACDFSKTVLLPRLLENREGKNQVVWVNLDELKGFELLQDFQKKHQPPADEKFPVLYFENALFYGNEEIEKLVDLTQASNKSQ